MNEDRRMLQTMNDFDTQQVPLEVQQYLELDKKIKDMKTAIKECKDAMSVLYPVVARFLIANEYEFPIHFDSGGSTRFGPNGKLHFTIEKRREYLGRHSLFNHIKAFFNDVFGNEFFQSHSTNIDEVSKAAVKYIYSNRKIVHEKMTISRTTSSNTKDRMQS